MQNKTPPLKNDQNNHLSDQVKHFEKIATRSQNNNSTNDSTTSYETLNLDNVTSAYIRGYN